MTIIYCSILIFIFVYENLKPMIVYPNAKINLGLNVVSRRSDGYHNLETVFYPVQIMDALEVKPLETDTDDYYQLQLSGRVVEGNTTDNLVVKALGLLKQDFEIPPVLIHLHKQIPTGAGLGGGSSDAAFMLKLLNQRFQLHLTDEQLEVYAAKIGADCAFFVRNQPVMATGIGNEFHPISLSLKGYHILLVKPEISISTKEAYQGLTPKKPQMPLTEILNHPIQEWKELMVNDFEATVFTQHPEIEAIKEQLYNLGAIYAAMSGSGSCVYGIFDKPFDEPERLFEDCYCRQRPLE